MQGAEAPLEVKDKDRKGKDKKGKKQKKGNQDCAVF